MRQLTSIVAVNHDGVIGAGNKLPWKLKTDMRFFKEETMGNVVLMGRKTFDSLGGKCLPGRYNIIVSHNLNLLPQSQECVAAFGIGDALFRAAIAPRGYQNHFVIGGASMYEQLAPYVERYLITMVDKVVENGDTYFDQSFLSNPDEWQIKKCFDVSSSSVDEAPFTVFEVRAMDPSPFQERRDAAIEKARASSMVKRSTQQFSRKPSSSGTSLQTIPLF
jgi:dihydrofolate reductase